MKSHGTIRCTRWAMRIALVACFSLAASGGRIAAQDGESMNEGDDRYQDTGNRNDAAQSAFFQENDERASGLHAVPPNERIRAGFYAWYDQGDAAARAFCGMNPKFRYFRLDIGDNFNEAFRLGRIDVMGWTNGYREHFGGKEEQQFDKTFPVPPKSQIIGYWPLAVAVHPSNSLEGLSLERLRVLATDGKATWKDLGRPQDGAVRLYTLDTIHLAALLTGKNDDGTLVNHRVLNGGDGQMGDLLKTVAGEPEAMLIWHYTERIAGSGLKILPIIDAHGRRALPTDLAAVASGRYTLRTPLTIVVHPQASEATRQFAQWLATDAAADVFRRDREQNHPADVPFLAHVTLAAKDAPGKPETSAGTAMLATEAPAVGNPVEPFAVRDWLEIEGAAAVMPVEPLSMYFLMADPSHQAAYEQTITDALRADGRLKLIDRTQLTRALEERKLELEGSAKASAKASGGDIIAADVIVFSCIVDEGPKAYLQIQAIHGPTSSLLGERKLPIDPADPTRFDPPLERTVADWWPNVLQRLADVRNKPRWTLVDVYADALETDDEATQAIHTELESALARDRRVFVSHRLPVGETQEEMLLRLMGLSHPTGGRFGPAADFLLEARLTASGGIDLRLLGGNLAVMDSVKIVAANRRAQLADATRWLTGQIAKHADKPPAPRPPAESVENDWAHAQARLEYEAGRRLSDQAAQQQKDHDIVKLESAARQHYRRAAQLDPAWEDAAYASLNAHGSDNWIFTDGVRREASFAEPIDACERFLKRFPASRHAQQVLADYAGGCMNLAANGKVPPGADQRATRLKFYRKGMEGCRRYIAEYSLQGKLADDWPRFMPTFYLYRLQKYVEFADPSADECAQIVEDWSKYDTRLDVMPHSDFVRLIIFAEKQDRPSFIELLTTMQQRWPDPKHRQWQETNQLVSDALRALFYDRGGGDSFDQWLAGKRGIGDLPRPGYNPTMEDRQNQR